MVLIIFSYKHTSGEAANVTDGAKGDKYAYNEEPEIH